MDVGVDTWGSAPVSLAEVLQAVTLFAPQKARQMHYVQKAWTKEKV